MNIITLVLLAFGMSMDAFAASLAKGSAHTRMTLLAALKVGVVFGVVEAITPVAGYFLGVMAESWVSRFDHWLSFILLSALGLHLIYQATTPKDDSLPSRTKNHWYLTILTAFATSIDAMVVGISLAFLGVNIWLASALIGVATTLMSTLGIYLGARMGDKIGSTAEVIGGVILIGIGGFILWSHLSTTGGG